MTSFAPRPLVPRPMFLTRGCGSHPWELRAQALMYWDAGIGSYNRVQVSSRTPPGCSLIGREEGIGHLRQGQLVFAVQAIARTCLPGARIASAIAVALPEDGRIGTVAEVHEDDSMGKNAAQAEDKALRMALATLSIELGHPDWKLAPDATAHGRHTIGGTAVRTHTISAGATGPLNGDWVKTIAALVFLF
ncbi:pyruvoyl-dependent arginine decarboxylase [Streptomyces sp. NPDC056528]|uniref:pyruvoyl-dependent arginine decarboxylase n=1 Tax=Streptomyces sp. NPDC056528 TaxID=3345854 RepID=UPI0036B29DE2